MIHTTPRLRIRPLSIGDAADFFAYRSDPEVTKFQSYHSSTLEDAQLLIRSMEGRAFGKKGEWLQLAILHLADKKVVGDLGIKPEGYDERVVEVGVTLSKAYQGQGIAKEAMGAVIQALFQQHGVHRVLCYIDVENAPSVAMFESMGFRREGLTIQSFCNKGVWRDEYLYAVLSSEWKQ
ncbi:MAG: GNAT family N-acetyltransferase [Saprospirales bacterium]|nr:GNAT family N-acetyltransferase [Saprospirales bacterium]